MVDRTAQMERLLGYYAGYFATHLIRLGVDTGLFRALADGGDEGLTASALAEALSFEPRYVEQFLRAGSALDLLGYRAAGGTYRLAPHMDVLLADPADYRYMGSLAHLYVQSGRDFDTIPELLRTGATRTFQQHDRALIDAAADSTEGLAQFVARAIVRRLPNLRHLEAPDILDLGCGTGSMLLALAKALPGSQLVGVDIEPYSVETAKARLRDAGLEGRAEARLAPAQDLGETAAYDLVTMVQVLHETAEDARAAVLARAHQALRPGGSLVVVDEPYPDDLSALPERPVSVLAQFVEMFMGNVMLSPQDQRRVLEQAGFEVVSQLIPAPGLICVTIARKPA